jgi:hypothetical protein
MCQPVEVTNINQLIVNEPIFPLNAQALFVKFIDISIPSIELAEALTQLYILFS